MTVRRSESVGTLCLIKEEELESPRVCRNSQTSFNSDPRKEVDVRVYIYGGERLYQISQLHYFGTLPVNLGHSRGVLTVYKESSQTFVCSEGTSFFTIERNLYFSTRTFTPITVLANETTVHSDRDPRWRRGPTPFGDSWIEGCPHNVVDTRSRGEGTQTRWSKG